MRSCAVTHSARGAGRTRSGLTIVELLAATVLATALIVAVLGVLQSMTRAQKTLLGEGTPEAWHARLAEQLDWDLANSNTVRATPYGFQLEGFAARDFSSGAPRHLPTVVEYRVVKTEQQSCLLRYETHLDSRQLDNRRAEIVCTGVEAITIDQSATAAPTNETIPQPSRPDLLSGPLPDRVTVTLRSTDAGGQIFLHETNLR